MLKFGFRTVVACLAILALAAGRLPADDKDGGVMKLGKVSLDSPEGWKKKTPRFARIVMYEYAAPAAKGDQADGRLTVGVLGSSIDSNVKRWLGQITQPDGSDTAKRAKIDKKTIAGRTVHLVDASGTYNNRFAVGGAATLPGYRLLAAIVETKDANFYVKLYGPKRTMAEHEKKFLKMIEGLK